MAHINKVKALQLWKDGLDDKEASKNLGCKEKSYANWRRENDLPSNKGIKNWKVTEDMKLITW